MACPNISCGAADPEQRRLTPGELASVRHAAWSADALRCAYCGCVYSAEHDGSVVRGHFDGMFIGWRPA